MLACFRLRAPEQSREPGPVRKPLWACEKPSEAADALRSIGLNRLAGTAISSQLSGHVLARLLDDLPAEHFLGVVAGEGGKPGADAAQEHKHNQQCTLEAQQGSQQKTVLTVPVDKHTKDPLLDGRPVSIQDYQLVNSPQPSAHSQVAPTPSQQQSVNSRNHDDDIIDTIPSARSPLNEYGKHSNSSHVAPAQTPGAAPSSAAQEALHRSASDQARVNGINVSVRPAQTMQTVADANGHRADAHGHKAEETDMFDTIPSARSPLKDFSNHTYSSHLVPAQSLPQPTRSLTHAAHTRASGQAPMNVINVSVSPAQSRQTVTNANGHGPEETTNLHGVMSQSSNACEKETNQRRRLLVGTKHFPHNNSSPHVRPSWRDSGQNGKLDHGIHTSASLGLTQSIAVATAPQKTAQWQGVAVYSTTLASHPDRNLIPWVFEQPERTQEGKVPAVHVASVNPARTVPVVHSVQQSNGTSVHAESPHHFQKALIDEGFSRAPEFTRSALNPSNGSTIADSGEQARSPFKTARLSIIESYNRGYIQSSNRILLFFHDCLFKIVINISTNISIEN
jgi:hypothetical protein